jgi:hypothetical protein
MTTQIGLCAAVFGDLNLDSMLDAVAALPVDFLDLPTDSTLALNSGVDDLGGEAHGDRVAQALKARRLTVRCVSNSRDTQLLLGPHGSHTDPVCAGSREEKLVHADRCARATVSLAARTGAEQVRLYFGSPDYALWLDWRVLRSTGPTACGRSPTRRCCTWTCAGMPGSRSAWSRTCDKPCMTRSPRASLSMNSLTTPTCSGCASTRPTSPPSGGIRSEVCGGGARLWERCT